jgi:hypothetical protein
MSTTSGGLGTSWSLLPWPWLIMIPSGHLTQLHMETHHLPPFLIRKSSWIIYFFGPSIPVRKVLLVTSLGRWCHGSFQQMAWMFLPHGLVDPIAGQFSGQGGTLKSGIEWPGSMCKKKYIWVWSGHWFFIGWVEGCSRILMLVLNHTHIAKQFKGKPPDSFNLWSAMRTWFPQVLSSYCFPRRKELHIPRLGTKYIQTNMLRQPRCSTIFKNIIILTTTIKVSNDNNGTHHWPNWIIICLLITTLDNWVPTHH